MIEARIALYCTCDFCGGFGRSEVPAIVQTLVWKQPEPQLRLPEGWRSDVLVGPSGRVERHRCAECVAKLAAKPKPGDAVRPDGSAAPLPDEVVKASAGLAAITPADERS